MFVVYLIFIYLISILNRAAVSLVCKEAFSSCSKYRSDNLILGLF